MTILTVTLILMFSTLFVPFCVLAGFWTGYYSIGWNAGLSGESCYALTKKHPDIMERAEIRGYRAALKVKE